MPLYERITDGFSKDATLICHQNPLIKDKGKIKGFVGGKIQPLGKKLNFSTVPSRKSSTF